MDQTITIEAATSYDDFEWCAKLMASSEPWITLRRSNKECLAGLRRPGRELYIARESGSPVGFVILCMTGAFVGYVQSICIDPTRRSAGLGSRLIAFAEQRVFRDSPNTFLCVSSFNLRALELYVRLGYEVVGTLRDYVVEGHDEILMRKSRGPISDFIPFSKP